MKVLIIEDEITAAGRLQKMINEIDASAEVVAILESISASIQWLQTNPHPDLLLLDIHLADGNSFEIFKHVQVNAPLIFTTAYDQYAIDAFKLHSVDYLLKPIKKAELEQAIDKYKKIYSGKNSTNNIEALIKSLQQPQPAYRERFVVKLGDHIKTVETSQIAWIYTENKTSFAITFENRRFPIDFTLDELENMIDPKRFFRINRQYIISLPAITDMLTYSKGRVLIKLNPAAKEETVVSTERSAAFKNWLAGA